MKNQKFNKRAFLKILFSTLFSSVAIATGGWIYATKWEPGWFEISTLSLVLPRLERSFDNYRIIHISDIHLGTWMTPDRFIDIVTAVNSLRPDLIAITGDFVTNLTHCTPSHLSNILSKLKAKDGVYAVLGNHDYWSNAYSIRQILKNSEVIELPNSVHTLYRGQACLHIAGIDDYWENKSRLFNVIQQIPDKGSAILLAHEPDFAVISARSKRFDLQLSGHTHGGQVILPKIGPLVLPMYGRKFPVGLYNVDGMFLYTNRGLGTGQIKIRFNCRPEIAMITLHTPMV